MLLKQLIVAESYLIILIYLLLVNFISLINSDKRHDQRFELVAEPASVLVALDGTRAVFKCTASPSTAEIRWLYNGNPIGEDSYEGIRITRHKLAIRLPKVNDNENSSNFSFNDGVFQCEAHHKNRVIISQPAKLIVAELNSFANQQNITLNAIEGNTAVIPCTPPHSVPHPVTEFTFNGTVIDKSKGNCIFSLKIPTYSIFFINSFFCFVQIVIT